MKYVVIGDEDTVLGFGMAGVDGYIAENGAEAEKHFNKIRKDYDAGIVLITERIAETIRPLIDHLMFTEEFPLILEIPDRKGKLEGRLGIREMVNAAIGLKI